MIKVNLSRVNNACKDLMSSYAEKVNITEKIPHTYAEKIISPTCEKAGYTLKICSVCSYEEKVNITEKLPHKYDEEGIEQTG